MWIVGQRVLAEYEPELGLGIVVNVMGTRLVEVLFPGAEIARRYSQQNPPLRRLVLSEGQRAKAKNGHTITITERKEADGLFLYCGKAEDGKTHEVWEYELDHVIEDLNPLAHLLMGKWSPPKTFGLRERAWDFLGRSLAADVKGLVGPRVSLLPHQIYIAREVSQREYPRVLLADEVGLGKTIEAGLIFSSLKTLGRANRVLVLAPESLKHQWLAEMYRRFNEMFSVVDEERSEEETASQGRSAFQMNQRVICSLDFLLQNPARLEEAVQESWDLLIIDEAHHLEWSEEDPSAEWEVARLLSTRARGLLLLTATPEHRGVETEFGLLHLVDPERFPLFSDFQKQNKQMHATAQLARSIDKGDRSTEFLEELKTHFKGDKDLQAAFSRYGEGGASDELLQRLIDRHGTGRVLIRNRRSRLQGFAERQLAAHALACPVGWLEHLQLLDPENLDEDDWLGLASGRAGKRSQASEQWFLTRANWLVSMLQEFAGEKVLLICSSPKRAVELQTWLRNESPARTAVFHEGLEVVERDRQAAWFAQPSGAQVLLCSEIGGEGRNFQFAHHLVLFDLPLHPDVLEQRIGRLDRIGQRERIQIHVPFLTDTPEEVFVRWYEEGLQSFLEPWSGGAAVETLRKSLTDAAKAFLPRGKNFSKRRSILEKLLKDTRAKVTKIREKQKESVDLLIDLNSFDETKGKALAKRIHEIDQSKDLRKFLEQAFDHFGVEVEEFDGPDTLKISTHSLTFVESFPGLSAHGERVVTYQRNLALAREEVAFLSWDHPIAQGALSLILEGETGQASVGSWSDSPQQTPLIVELLYVVQATAPVSLEIERDLPLRPLKLFLSLEGKLMEPPPGLETATLKPVPPQVLAPAQEILREKLPQVVEKANVQLRKQTERLVQEAILTRANRINAEYERLHQLAKVNLLISKQELEDQKAKLTAGEEALRAVVPRLEGIRLILKN